MTGAERLAVYTHLRTFESDFDKSQSQMRAICSTWSGVVLAAIALLVTNAYTPPSGMADADLVARAETLAALRTVVCFIGSAGVYAFWFIDQRIYQRLLHSVFAYGLFVEFKNPDLPQIRSSMFIANLDVTNGLAWFYRTQFMLFVVISAVFVFAVGGKITSLTIGLFITHLLGVVLGEGYSESWPSLRGLVGEIYGSGDFAQAMPGPRGEGLAEWQQRVRAAPIPAPPPDVGGPP